MIFCDTTRRLGKRPSRSSRQIVVRDKPPVLSWTAESLISFDILPPVRPIGSDAFQKFLPHIPGDKKRAKCYRKNFKMSFFVGYGNYTWGRNVRISAVYAAMAWFANNRQTFSKKLHSEYSKLQKSGENASDHTDFDSYWRKEFADNPDKPLNFVIVVTYVIQYWSKKMRRFLFIQWCIFLRQRFHGQRARLVVRHLWDIWDMTEFRM